MDNKNYAAMSLEELTAAEQKFKKWEIMTAIMMGVLIGVLIYGVAAKGFGFLHIFLPLLVMYGLYQGAKKNKENLQAVKAELAARGKLTKK